MHTLVIKGDEAAAFAACGLHNMEVTSIVRHSQFDECIVTVPATVPVANLVAWLCEDDAQWLCLREGDNLHGSNTLAAGSLLWYGPAKQEVQS